MSYSALKFRRWADRGLSILLTVFGILIVASALSNIFGSHPSPRWVNDLIGGMAFLAVGATIKLALRNYELDLAVAARTRELKASEARLALAVRGSSDGLWDWDIETNKVYYTPRSRGMLELRDKGYANQLDAFNESLHPDDFNRTWDALRRHMEQRVPYDIEHRLRTSTGEYRWFRSQGQAIWNDAGQAIRMAGSLIDIDRQKSAEFALRQERFLLDTLLKNLPDAIYFKDTAGCFLRVSSSLAKHLGANHAAELIGRMDADFFPAEYAATARTDEEELIRGVRTIVTKEEQPKWADGTRSWVLTTKIPLRDAEGQIIGTFGISRDISALKHAEERFRQVVIAAPLPLLVINEWGIVQLANAATERLFGASQRELLNQPIEKFIPELPCTDPLQEGCAIPERMHRYCGEAFGTRKDGAKFPLELRFSPVSFEDEQVILASIFDLTDRKEVEQALIVAKEIAEDASRSKSAFLANMSHEIRTPMNSILGFTELLRREKGTVDQQRFYLDTIHASGRHLLCLIDDILDLSKIETGQMEFEHIECSPHQVIGEVMSVLRVKAQEKQLRLECRWTSGVPETIQTDPARLRQLLINLVGNAIKFTEQGGVELLINVDLSSPEPRLSIEVHDTGIGITKDQISNLFVPFKQADSSVTRRFGGTGLGLAISRYIARQLGGDISVTSEPGVGSTFAIAIATGDLENVRIFDSPPSEVLLPSNQRTNFEAIELSAARILLVEDGESNRDLVSLVLQEAGAHVATAENGEEGLLLAARGGFDLVLMDMQMPVMDGYTATRRLRTSGFTAPIIALTAHAMRGDDLACLDAGCTSYLRKPLDIDELLREVNAVLNPQARRTVVSADQMELDDGRIMSTLPVEHLGFRTLVESFLTKLPDKVDAIAAAIAADDVDEILHLAHWLKGTGGTMGFACLTEPAERLEELARDHNQTSLSHELKGIKHLIERLSISN